jgi:hypothetical protein
MISFAEWLALALASYAAIGIVFALAFVTLGVQRVDPAARTGTIGFRILILPGAAAFWPLLLKRWAMGSKAPPGETNAHRRRARAPASKP